MSATPQGKFIVIDGTDGSGKTTQFNLLLERLQKNGYKVKTTDFPQYGKKSAAPVEEYLNGKYGSPDEVGPYRASILFAVDRYDASFQIKQWLQEGYIILSDRYVSGNMGHQGGKIKDKEELKKYLDWLYNLEYNMFEIPKPDLNLILHVPSEIANELISKRDDKEYIENKQRDIHEEDLNHLKAAEETYLHIVDQFPDFTRLECTKNNEMMSREKISDLIWDQVMKIIETQPKLEI